MSDSILDPEDDDLLAAALAIADGTSVELTASTSGLVTLERLVKAHRQLASQEVSETAALTETLFTAARRSTIGSTADLQVRWGPLIVLEKVGRGSFGDVYRAWDPQLDRHVALKLIPEHRASDTAESILTEGRLLARVRHPNVVTIHGADRIEGRVGLWMEFVKGHTLDRLLAERGAFGAQEALLVGVDLCHALSAVHAAGVLHRDVKTHNVVREEGGRIVLMDFGTGREPAGKAPEELLSGTPLYLAPELFAGRPATAQSDIYSLGVLLFHLVTRSYPVVGRSVDELRAGHREGRRVWLRDIRPDLSSPFIRAIEPALAPEPSARYQSVGAMEQALLSAVSGNDVAAASPSVRERFPVRWHWIAAGVGVLAVAIAAGLAFPEWFGGSDGPPNRGNQAAAGDGEITARRVSMPAVMNVGRPSPDGRYLSYVDLNGDLCLKDLATGEVRMVTKKGASAEGADSQIASSPDGGSLAFTWRTLDGASEIRVVSEDGTWPRVLLRRDDVAFPAPLQWSADGTEILAMLELANRKQELVLISTATGNVRLVRTFEGGRINATLSPDGRFVAFDRLHGDQSIGRDIYVTSVAAGEPRPLVVHPANDAFPTWAPDGRLLFVSDRTGSPALWAQHVADGAPSGEPQLLARDLGRLAMPLGLTNGGAYYYHVQNGMVDVYEQEIDVSRAAAPGSPRPMAALGVGSNMSSEWSPDGRRVAYVSLRGFVQNDHGSRLLVIRDAASGQQVELRPALLFFIAPRWSPDGRTILVRGVDLNSREGLFKVDVATGRTEPAVVFPLDQVRSATFQWSPDGRSVWYEKSEARAIVARDLTTDQEESLVEYGAGDVQRLMQWPGFRIAPDGRSIAYTGFTFTNNKAGTLVRVHRLDGTMVDVARAASPERVEVQDWTPDGRGLLLVRRNTSERKSDLYVVGLDGSAPRPLGMTMDVREVGLRRDGKAITYTAGANSLEVWMLDNFLENAAGVSR